MKWGLPILALLIAIGASAFTSYQKSTVESDLVWFKVNQDGSLVDGTAGIRGDNPPIGMNCQGNEALCAKAFSISAGEVEPYGTSGQYEIKPTTDVNEDHDDQRLQNLP